MPDLTPRPWHRQPSERSRAYHLFVRYYEAGKDRTLPRLAQAEGVPYSTVEKLCTRWEWIARVRAWETFELEDIHERARVRAAGMLARHAALGDEMVELGRKILERVREKPGKAGAAVAVALIGKGVEIERLSCGLATERVEATVAAGNPEARFEAELRDPELRRHYDAIAARRAALRLEGDSGGDGGVSEPGPVAALPAPAGDL